MQIDFTPLVQPMIQLSAMVLAVMGPYWIHRWVAAHSNAQNQQAMATLQDRLDALFGKALAYGETVADAQDAHYLEHVTIRDPKMASAAAFAVRQFPAALKLAGVDVETPSGQAALVRMLTARLGAPAAK